MLLTEMPFDIVGQSALLPAVTLAAVWFWSVFRPASMPPPLVFGIGLLLDLLGYLPLGTGVLTLLIVHGIALRWRRFLAQQGFAVIWAAFSLVASGAAVSAALYPALAIPLAAAHASIAAPERA
jgi:rod shape-determining protein MreD